MDELIKISRRYGADPAFVLAGGGNTSFKKGNRLWVKASGHALATIGPNGFVELDRDALEAMLNYEWPADAKEREALFIERVMATRLHPELKQRPSVEALIHHLLPDALVVHTHPGIVNALTCCADGEKLAAELFGEDVLWQPYVDPGVVLAQALRSSIAGHVDRTGRPPAAILLANHGLIVSGKSADEIQKTSDRLLGEIAKYLGSKPAEAWDVGRLESHREVLESYAQAMKRLAPELHVVADASAAIGRLAGSKGGRDAALAGPLTPDQIVYCRSVPLWIEKPSDDPIIAQKQCGDAREAYLQKFGLDPWVGLIAGEGMIAFRESAKLAEVTRSIYVDSAEVYHNAARLGGMHVLSSRDRRFIEEWEVEAYRRSVMSKSAAS
jgi:rhamnose utilization protein RhaD (predicted bifunctional aldolase and dehydrogenase)